jgi:hypothetical protein
VFETGPVGEREPLLTLRNLDRGLIGTSANTGGPALFVEATNIRLIEEVATGIIRIQEDCPIDFPSPLGDQAAT